MDDAVAATLQYEMTVTNAAGRPITHLGDVSLATLADQLAYGARTTALDWQAKCDAARNEVMSLVGSVEFRIAPGRRAAFDAAFQRFAEALVLSGLSAGALSADQLQGATMKVRLGPDGLRHWLQ